MDKAAQLRAAKAREDVGLSFIPALATNTTAGIEEMTAKTRAGLLSMVPARHRRSEVRSWHVHGQAECDRMLRAMYEDGDPEQWAIIVAQFFPFTAKYGDDAVLVVAECDTVAPR